jgi:multicomponent Na+:H+ antiporter subunit A
MTLLLLLHLAAAVVCLTPGRAIGRAAVAIAALPPVATFVWLLTQSTSVLDGHPVDQRVTWIPQLGLDIVLRLDGFALFMGLLVSGIGSLVLLYCWWYFDHEPRVGRVIGLLVGFAGAMLGLVFADGLLTLFVFWELTSVTSFFLIGFDDSAAAARTAATRALLVTTAGGLAMFAGLVLLGQQSGEWTISGLLRVEPTGTVVAVALVLVLFGAFTKSAQFPFHFWLPGAMAAPTPVSAYLHSATMVKAGLVVAARFAPVFADIGIWRPLAVSVGVITLLVGGARALRQQDAKLALAHGTVSQLGLLMVLLSLGTPATTFAGVAMLCAHALYKCALFLVIGIVDHQAHTRDLRRLRGLTGRMPVVAGTAFAAAASMAALPPTFGYVTKESGLEALVHLDVGWTGTLALVGVTIGSVLTVAYTLRLTWEMFGSHAPGVPSGDAAVDPASIARPRLGFVVAPALLAALSLAFGLAAAAVAPFFDHVTASLLPAGEQVEGHLALWAGFGPALAISAAIILVGAIVGAVVVRVERGADPRHGIGESVYAHLYDGLLAGARRVTAVTQSGSLPLYLGVVFSVVLAIVVWMVITDGVEALTGWPLGSSAIEVVASGLTAAIGVSVLTAKRRFTAAVLLGGTGYGLAVVFLIRGAPDLAITQFLIESLTIVMFLLVFARLPDRFDAAPSWAPQPVRVALAVAVGAGLAVLALMVPAARTEPSVGDEYMARSVPEGGGRNVVNVTLVDFRGLDTQGEITVLAIAAIGVVNIVSVARREQRRRRLADGTDLESDPSSSLPVSDDEVTT